MDSGFILYLVVGCSVLLPLGARIAGNTRMAKRLDLLPRFSFGFICLLLAFHPGSTFSLGSDRLTSTPGEPLSGDVGRPVFGAIGLALIGTGIRKIVRKDFDQPDPDN